MACAGAVRRAGPTLALVLLFVACTGTDRERGAAMSPGAPAAGSSRTDTLSPTAVGTPSTAPTRQPLVLAVHATRPPLRLSEALARDVVQGEVRSWRDLGHAPAPLRVLDGAVGAPEAAASSAREALRAVTRDRDALALLPAEAVDPRVQVARVDGTHPLRHPDAYPLAVPGPPAPRPVTVSVVGDLMLGRRVGAAATASGDVAAPLRPTADRLARADLTIGNLESTLSRAGSPTQGGDSFAADPGVLDGLGDAGVDVLSLANNHAGDFGPRALVRTVRRVERSGIVPVGAGANADEAGEPAVVERGGLRFGVLAFNAIGETPRAGRDRPGAVSLRMQPRTGPLDEGDLTHMTRAVERLRSRVDVVLVVPHWGAQYTNEPVRDQRVVARALAEAGADLVVGGHPHWVQGVSWAGGTVVAYSLGNFVFDMDFSRETREGVILEAVLWGGEPKAVELVPVRIGDDFAPRVVRGRAGERILERMWATSRGPFRPR